MENANRCDAAEEQYVDSDLEVIDRRNNVQEITSIIAALTSECTVLSLTGMRRVKKYNEKLCCQGLGTELPIFRFR
jgi:hypothetical protein